MLWKLLWFFANRQMSKKEIKLMFSDRNNKLIISWWYHQQGVKYFVVFWFNIYDLFFIFLPIQNLVVYEI